jgi:hypothetical protein
MNAGSTAEPAVKLVRERVSRADTLQYRKLSYTSIILSLQNFASAGCGLLVLHSINYMCSLGESGFFYPTEAVSLPVHTL